MSLIARAWACSASRVISGAQVAALRAQAGEFLQRGLHQVLRVALDDFAFGIDIVVDPVGGALFSHALRAAAQNAQLLSIGFASGTLPQIQPNLLLVKNLTLHGFFYGRYIGWTPADESVVHAPALQRAMITMMGWARSARIRPAISRVFPMDSLSEALEALHSREVIGKVALAIKPKLENS